MKTTTSLLVAAVLLTLGSSENIFAQQKTKTYQKSQQRTWVQPGATYVQPQPMPQPAPKMGFNGQMIYNYGMKVVSVNWGSAAQRAGLESGDVITQINGRNIYSDFDYRQALRDAAQYQYGQLNLKVRNVRHDWGHNVPKYVFVTTVLDGFSGPVGPVVPASPVGPIAPRSQQQRHYHAPGSTHSHNHG